MKLFLKGERCFSPKCSVEKRNYAPGDHGKKATFRHKDSEYSLQLREKQKVRRFYGVQERQFRRYFHSAQRVQGQTGVTLLITLERRLDNVIYRLGFAVSRAQARQLVRHGHFTLNGHNHDVPSYLVKVGDLFGVRPGSRGNTYFQDALQRMDPARVPAWLEWDPNHLTARVVAMPDRQSVDIPLNEQLIVEYYSR
jgi:small subunit ribosomal protein S4